MTTRPTPISTAAAERLAAIVRESDEPSTPTHPDYEIECEIGRGGMGTVYVAFDKNLHRRVAMKVMRDESPSFRERFVFEASRTANLQHANIVPVFDLGTLPDRRPFYTMRLLTGLCLGDLITELHCSVDPREKLPALLRMLCQVCDALSYAHQEGVVHRDLKPDNIMIGRFNQVWVLDWGLAKLWDASSDQADAPTREDPGARRVERAEIPSTKAGHTLGTPGYMAPEQVEGDHDRIGPATDVYAAGAVLFHILTGRAPFPAIPSDRIPDGTGQRAVLLTAGGQRTAKVLRTATVLWPGAGDFPIPRPLRSVVDKAMMLLPEERYASAAGLADDLRRWMDGQPLDVHRENLWERAIRLGKRYRVAIAVVVGYLLMRMAVLALVGR